MTLLIPREQSPARTPERSGVRVRDLSTAISLGLLLVTTAGLYLWNLGAGGWANAFYSAAVQAGSQNVTALFFGSSDAANAITVDKPPAALWVMGLSARLFGVNAWSILAPQAVMGVAAVAVLYAAVRRSCGPGAGLLAGWILALTPVAALIFRFNNPDALLVLTLVVGAYCTLRACEQDASRWWLVGAGVAVGVGFLAKMLQALLVLPAFAATYLLAAHRPLRRRVVDLGTALLALIVSAGWYVLAVELWPADRRPYIGGSQTNSMLELTLGYNGIGRLTGNEPGGLGNLNHDVGWGRLLGYGMGADIGWLLPAALVLLAAGLVITRRRARTDPSRAALILWGGWLLTTAVVFSGMHGIVHPYYTVALAPAVAAVIGVGAPLVWRRRRDPRAATTLALTVAITAALSAVLLGRFADWHPWLRGAVAVTGLGAAVLLLVTARLPARVTRGVAGLALVACLGGPAAISLATAATPHSGSIPSVGPSRGFDVRGGGLLSAPDTPPDLITALCANADDFDWGAAVVGSNNAAGYQLASGVPVLAVGGFNGTDPYPTLEQFISLVDTGRIHYFIEGPTMMMGRRAGDTGNDASAIREWVQARFPETTVGGTVVYDLTGQPEISQPSHSSAPR